MHVPLNIGVVILFVKVQKRDPKMESRHALKQRLRYPSKRRAKFQNMARSALASRRSGCGKFEEQPSVVDGPLAGDSQRLQSCTPPGPTSDVHNVEGVGALSDAEEVVACDAVVADIHSSVVDADDEQGEELYSSRTGSTGKERVEAGDTSGSEYFPSPKKLKGMGTCPVDLGNSIFLCQTSQLTAFIDQINATSVCGTCSIGGHCRGKLVPTSFRCCGRGGVVRVDYCCSGCAGRKLVFESSEKADLKICNSGLTEANVQQHDKPDKVHAVVLGEKECERTAVLQRQKSDRMVNVALSPMTGAPKVQFATSARSVVSYATMIAFLASGVSYAKYRRIFKSFLSVNAFSPQTFIEMIGAIHPHVCAMLDNMCSEAKAEMKQKHPREIGSWERAVTTADGCWLTRGHHSKNATFTVRNYLSGALLYYSHHCQRGRDKVTSDELWMGTSKAAEGHAADLAFKQAKLEGMHVDAQWQDNDSSSGNAFLKHFPKSRLMLCANHAARSHKKALLQLGKAKSFPNAVVKKYSETYPGMGDLRCCCKDKHKKGCGCISASFINHAVRNFHVCLDKAHTEHAVFSKRMNWLGKYHARNVHLWSDDCCDFHPLLVCSCKQCGEDIQCQGTEYRTRNTLTCEFHALAYEIECKEVAEKSEKLIHPDIGKGTSNLPEASHSVLIKFRSKDMNLERLHYTVSTNLGLIQSNMTWLNNERRRGTQYHWLLDLFGRLNLPIFDGLKETLSKDNERRMAHIEYIRKESVRKRRVELRYQRNKDSERRKKASVHTYYGQDNDCPDDVVSPSAVALPLSSGKQPAGVAKRAVHCKCGSTTHSRISHRDCRLNVKRCNVPVDNALSSHRVDTALSPELSSDDVSVSSEDEGVTRVESEDSCISVSSDDDYYFCSCPGRAHSRLCPLNPRNRGAKAVGSFEKAPAPSKDSSCEIVKPSGPLPSSEWKWLACEVLRRWSDLSLRERSEPVKSINCPEIMPHICDAIVGDGNCLFRAFSKEVTGTQDNHKAVRIAITSFMSDPDNARVFGPLFFGVKGTLDDVSTYVETSGMCDNAWGTEKEITVAATLFQVDILVFTEYGKERKWTKFFPAFSNLNCTITLTGTKFHIYHTPKKNHYHRVIPSLTD